jgi:hypothetical protein
MAMVLQGSKHIEGLMLASGLTLPMDEEIATVLVMSNPLLQRREKALSCSSAPEREYVDVGFTLRYLTPWAVFGTLWNRLCFGLDGIMVSKSGLNAVIGR